MRLDDIYQALIADSYIKDNAYGRIKYFTYPEAASLTEPHIVIDPLDVPRPDTFADNTWLKDDVICQIEVWTKERKLTNQLASKVRDVMWQLGYVQGSGPFEYDKDYQIYRDARRYSAKLYRD